MTSAHWAARRETDGHAADAFRDQARTRSSVRRAYDHMATDGPAHYVFVDFENVPTVDLGLIGDKPVEVTLLIGEKQKRLDLALVRQIHRYASKVALIEVGATGRNALDLVLACHLGTAVAQHPEGRFYIISKDKDFNPLIAHLRAGGTQVSRHDAFPALPFLAGEPKQVGPDERLAKLVDILMNKARARPVRRKTLLSHISAFYANRLSPAEVEAVIATLVERGIIAIDARGRVSYL